MGSTVEEREKETLIQLLKYVESIADKKGELQTHDLQQYAKEGGMVVTKEELQDIVAGLDDEFKQCVQFDLEQEGPVWLKFERMPKSTPPDIPRSLIDVVTVGPSSKPEHRPQITVDGDAQLSEQQQNAFDEFSEIWRSWAAYEETRAIYTGLFGLYHELQNEGMEKPVEVVWGIGQVVWKYKGVVLKHPIIELLVEIDINTNNGAILVRPREQVLPELALGRFSGAMPDLNTNVERVHNHTRSMMLPGSISPFLDDTYMPILRATSVHLSDSGQVLNAPPGDATEQLCIYNSWAIYSRGRCTNFFVQDIRQLMVELRKPNSEIPAAALRLVREPSHTVNAARSALDDDDSLQDYYFPRPSNTAQADIIRRLETSDAVIVEGPPGTGKTHTISNIICHFLATGRRVLVTSKGEPAVEVLRGQIPEGVRELTISLTTSEREGLKQLEHVIEHIANKISQGNPGKIDREIKSIENMVREIKQQLHDFDREIEELASKQLRPHTLDLGAELTALNPAKLAEKLAKPENKMHRFIPDQLDAKFEEDPLFEESTIQEIRAIRTEVGTALLYSGIDLPELRFFPATSDVTRLFQAVTEATRAISQSEDLAIELEDKANEEIMHRVTEISLDDKPSMQTAATVIVEGLAKCVGALHQIEHARADWFLVHCRAWRTNGSRKLIDLTKMAKNISKSREDFMLRPVRLPPHRSIVEYCQTFHSGKAEEPLAPLLDAVGALAQGKSTTSMFSSLMASIPLVGNSERSKQQQLEALLGEVTVSNRAPRTPEDWEWVRASLVFRDTVSRFVEQWNLLVEARQAIGSPDHRAARMECQHLHEDGTVDVERAAIWVSDTCVAILQAASTVDAAVFAVRGALIELQLDENLVLGNAATARMLRQKLSSKLNLSYVEPARQKLQQLANDLRVSVRGKAPVVERMSSLLNQVAQSGEIPNLHSKEQMERLWDLLLAEVENAHNMQGRIERLKELTQTIRQSGAPKWADLLETQPILPAASTEPLEELADKLAGLPRVASFRKLEDELTSPTWRKIWNLMRAESFLRSVDGRKRINYIMRSRRQLTQELERIFLNVVTRRTELHLRTSLSEAAQSALVRFITALSHAGHTNSNSVRASRYQEEARVSMQRCYGAVPCWIMPTWRVSQFIPADLGSFDLVIVDEASQSDIQALPALLRGKKLLIVGDAKQVSPTEAFVSEEKITHLRTMLQSQLYSELMLPGRSLFDLSRAVFPGSRIVLTEHFRCARPIVAYSNARFYAGQLQPLRIPKASERLRPTLVDCYLPDGEKRGKVNYDEANAIVEEIAALSADPATAHRSIGVISLIGSEQAKLLQGMLLEQLGEEAFMRHKVTCGDPSAFQGNEKDIIFLSMIAAPGQCPGQIGLQWEQRFNVAMTRARDRMYLFRSIKSEQISNPSDLKATIIRHFQSAQLHGESADGVDSMDVLTNEVQKDIFSRLRAKGYRVRCQVVVGGLAIDFVVEGVNDERVAVCIDGKDSSLDLESWRESVKQQHVMERVGWTFWRCWKSSYLLAPDECIDDLVGLLSSLDIGPWPESLHTHKSGSSVGSVHSNEDAEVHRSSLAFIQATMAPPEERHLGSTARVARGSPDSTSARASRVLKTQANAKALKKRYLSTEDDDAAGNSSSDETASKASSRAKRSKAAPATKAKRGAAAAAAEAKSTKRKAPARGNGAAKKKAARTDDSDDDFIVSDGEGEDEVHESPKKVARKGAAAKAAPAGGRRRAAKDEYVPSDDSGAGSDYGEDDDDEDVAPAPKRKAPARAPKAPARQPRQAASAAAEKRKAKQAEMSELRDAYGDAIDSDVSSIRSNDDDYYEEAESKSASTNQSRARSRSGAARDKPASPTKRKQSTVSFDDSVTTIKSQPPSQQPKLIEALRAELISARYTGSLDDQSLLNALAAASYDVKTALETLCPNNSHLASFHVTGRWKLW